MTRGQKSAAEDRTTPWKVVTVVLSYWTISISMVFTNKYLVGSPQSELDISLFAAWVQCIVTAVFVFIPRWCQHRYVGGQQVHVNLSMLKDKHIILMTCSYVGMLSFNNLCLHYMTVAFFLVARCMTMIFVVILSMLIMHKTVSLKVVACCFIVTGGFALATTQESRAGTLSVPGIVFGVLASVCVALHGIFTKKAVEMMNHDSVLLTMYININGVLLFFPIVLMTGQLQAVVASDIIYSVQFWVLLTASGILGFTIAWITVVQIDVTSPMTHHISANAKSVLQTLIAVAYYREEKSFLWWFSIFLVAGGATSYAVIKVQEAKTVPTSETKRE